MINSDTITQSSNVTAISPDALARALATASEALDDARVMLALTQLCGSPRQLAERLGMTIDRVAASRERLVEAGHVSVGRGRGGVLHLVERKAS